MKKVIALSLLLAGLVSLASADILVGARQAGMGGCGVASAVGLTSIAYNPAGLLSGPVGELVLSAGWAQKGLDQVSQSLQKATDPAQFMIDNYATNLNANGLASGIFGLNIAGTGISILLPTATANLAKPANTLVGTADVSALGAAVLTVGNSFSVPALPAALTVGLNLKALSLSTGALNITGDPTSLTPVTATQTVNQGSGFGFDVGVRTKFEIPYLTEFTVGASLLDVSQSVKYKPTSRTDTYKIVLPSTTPILVKGTDVTSAEITANSPTTTLIGCSGIVPGIGLRLALDIESISGGSDILAVSSDTITHLGLEYPIFLGAVVLRAGTASGQHTNLATYGVKLNVPLVTLEMAGVTDNKDSANNSYVVDLGFNI